jgi:2-succinyl-5-enolpyruvyl-6-hydroxy-3-cyclohexene-1-carboxylate synthase
VVARRVADIFEVVVLAAGTHAFLRGGGTLVGRFSTPVKTFLNCTIPALVNNKVGSLRGTSGLDGTISCPLAAK